MTVGAEGEGVETTHAALALLCGMVEDGRVTAGMLSPDEVWTCSDATVDALLVMHAQLESVTAAIGHLIVRDLDVRDLASKDGKATTASWLAKKLTLHPGETTARVKTADLLSRKATATQTALIEGRINADQARAIARGLAKVEPHATAEEFTGAERFLLREGIGLHSGHITRLARHIENVLDPDGKEPKERARKARTVTV